MRYTINIDYIDQSIGGQTAKLTLIDENKKKILNKVPVSLPNSLFEEKYMPFYYDLNEKTPNISQIDFQTNKFKELFEKNPAFEPLYIFAGKDNYHKTFNKNNDEYVMHKKHILFFPQEDGQKLGVDEQAFILHENDHKILTNALKNATGLNFDVRKARFAMFNNFEDRNINKTSDINKMYSLLKEVLLHKASMTEEDSLVNKRMKEARRKQFNKITGRVDIDDVNENSLNEAPFSPENKEMEIKKDQLQERQQDKKETQTILDTNKNRVGLFYGENTNNIISNKILEINKRRELEDRERNNRNIDFMFLLSIYNYFALQDISFNKEMIKRSLDKIPGGNNIKDIDFVSNENGFFISMYGKEGKKDSLCSLTFDYGKQSFSLKNESSEITLSPSIYNDRILNITADYNELQVAGELINFKNNKGNSIDEYLTICNLKSHSNNIIEEFSFATRYSFDYDQNGFNKLSFLTNEKNSPINIDLIYNTQKEKTGTLIDERLTNLNVHFEGRNEAQFIANKEHVHSSIDQDLLNEMTKEDIEKDLTIQRNTEKDNIENNNAETTTNSVLENSILNGLQKLKDEKEQSVDIMDDKTDETHNNINTEDKILEQPSITIQTENKVEKTEENIINAALSKTVLSGIQSIIEKENNENVNSEIKNEETNIDIKLEATKTDNNIQKSEEIPPFVDEAMANSISAGIQNLLNRQTNEHQIDNSESNNSKKDEIDYTNFDNIFAGIVEDKKEEAEIIVSHEDLDISNIIKENHFADLSGGFIFDNQEQNFKNEDIHSPQPYEKSFPETAQKEYEQSLSHNYQDAPPAYLYEEQHFGTSQNNNDEYQRLEDERYRQEDEYRRQQEEQQRYQFEEQERRQQEDQRRQQEEEQRRHQEEQTRQEEQRRYQEEQDRMRREEENRRTMRPF